MYDNSYLTLKRLSRNFQINLYYLYHEHNPNVRLHRHFRWLILANCLRGLVSSIVLFDQAKLGDLSNFMHF